MLFLSLILPVALIALWAVSFSQQTGKISSSLWDKSGTTKYVMDSVSNNSKHEANSSFLRRIDETTLASAIAWQD